MSTLLLISIACPLLVAGKTADVLPLTRVTFSGAVLANKGENEGPENFVVLFCADWFSPCQDIEETWKELAGKHGGVSTDSLFHRRTRFAQVDCAVDKELCNTQDVDTYPTLVHYHLGGRTHEWSFSGRESSKEIKSFEKWVEKVMTSEHAPAADTSMPTESPQSILAVFKPMFDRQAPAQMAPMLCLLIAGFMWTARLIGEIYQSFQDIQEMRREPRVKGVELPAQPVAEPEKQQGSSSIRCLPESWAKERESMEL